MTGGDPRVDDELRHHIQERTDRLVADGMDPDEAHRQAERAFGDVDAVRREVERIDNPVRSAPGRLFDRIRFDLAFAVRQLRRSPGYALVAILTIGLGIGASTSIFGLVKAVVLDPLPYPNADALVLFNEMAPDGLTFTVSDPNYQDYRERLEGLEHLTAVSRADYSTDQDGRPRRVVSATVTGGFFPLFGGAPTLGRTFTEDESGADAVQLAVLSHDFWADHYAQDPDVVGRTLPLDGLPFEVVGVMPDGWEPLEDVDVWTPLPLTYQSRDNHDFMVVGRVASGTTLAAARAELSAAAEALARDHPETNQDWSARIVPLKEALLGPERVRAGWVLLGAVGLLLLMACASVSNLLLARASVRGREMQLRASLGAGRWRLVQQLLTESLVLSGAGAAVGMALTMVFLPALQALSPADTPRLDQAAVGGGVVLFAVGVALACALLFGLAPVLHLLRDALSARAGRGHGGGRASDRVRHALVAGQVALSLTLLVGAAALGRSFLALQDVDAGLPLENAVVVPLMMSGDRYTMDERAVARTAMVDALEALPGVEAVGSTNVLPFSGMNTVVNINVEGRPTTPDRSPFVRWRAVSPGFLEAAGKIPLAGRGLRPADFDRDAEDVVVLSATLARMLFDDPADAVDQRIAMSWNGANYRRVVGVVPDLEDQSVREAAPALFFFPDPGMLTWVNMLVRFEDGAAAPSAAAVREAIWSVDPGLPVPSVERLDERFRGSVAGFGFNLLVMGVFASVALVLSLLGIYGVVLFAVERRTREIGVRMALGARPEGVVRLVLAQGLRLAGAGVAVGVVLSLVLARYLDALLFRTDATAPLQIAVPAVLLALTALAATWLPAHRATRIDPREALGAE